MWLNKTAEFMNKGLSPFAKVIGAIGAGFIGLMMMVTVIDVAGRRFFNAPLTGSMDLSILMMVVVVFSSIAYCELGKGHIVIDLIVPRLQKRTQAFINSFMYLLFLLFFAWATWRIFIRALELLRNETVSATLEIPVFPFMFVATLGCALLSLLVLMHLLTYVAGVAKK